MMFRKRANFRRRPRFTRRAKRAVRRIPRPRLNNQIHSFKQVVDLPSIALSTTAPATFFKFTHQFNDIPNQPSLATLYDQYRILAVKVTFYPVNTVTYANSQASSTSLEIPQFASALDYDGSTGNPSTVSEVNQYSTCKRSFFNRPHTRYYKPKPSSYALYTAVSNTYGFQSLSPKTWCDMGQGAVKYNSILGYIEYPSQSATTPSGLLVKCAATYYFQCRNVK